jgi:hypothetical protein
MSSVEHVSRKWYRGFSLVSAEIENFHFDPTADILQFHGAANTG